MRYEHVNIESFGYELPPLVLSSSEIEEQLRPVYQRLKLPEGRLELMTGIRARRLWHPGTMPSTAAAAAGEKALAAAGIHREKIGALIMCSVSRDFLEPATATIVHNKLGLPENSLVFDISNACLGILTGMISLGNMIELGQIEAGLLVSGENSRPLLESTIRSMLNDMSLTRQSIKPYFASLTIGSGSVAVLMTSSSISKSPLKLKGGASRAITRHNELCRGNLDKGMTDGSETLMNTDSEELMRRGVEAAAGTWPDFLKETGWTPDGIDCICTHQVGTAHKRLLFETLGLDPAKDFQTLDSFGNIGSASCPLTAAMAIESGRVFPGAKLALLGIGSGINCTMLGVGC
ncbi:MAG: 3-oxoacyl-ACP synthase III [Lentisphaerae bacterium GWF2_52_8]|nr:MAG: 3-oxoacyl-ACP synthase III [Lentisphaerae bacterium GWF2_52_8]